MKNEIEKEKKMNKPFWLIGLRGWRKTGLASKSQAEKYKESESSEAEINSTFENKTPKGPREQEKESKR